MGRRLTSVSTATSRSLIWITDLNVKDCKSSAQEEKKKKRENIFATLEQAKISQAG